MIKLQLAARSSLTGVWTSNSVSGRGACGAGPNGGKSTAPAAVIAWASHPRRGLGTFGTGVDRTLRLRMWRLHDRRVGLLLQDPVVVSTPERGQNVAFDHNAVAGCQGRARQGVGTK